MTAPDYYISLEDAESQLTLSVLRGYEGTPRHSILLYRYELARRLVAGTRELHPRRERGRWYREGPDAYALHLDGRVRSVHRAETESGEEGSVPAHLLPVGSLGRRRR